MAPRPANDSGDASKVDPATDGPGSPPGSLRLACLLGVGVLVLASGCAGLPGLGNDTIRYTATQATVCDSVLEGSGYSLEESRWVNATWTVGEANRTLRAGSYLNGYVREAGTDLASDAWAKGSVVVLSTPRAEEAGVALNPVGSFSPGTLVDEVGNRLPEYGQFRNLTPTETYDLQVLGGETNVTTFAGVGGDDGVPVRVHVTRIRHGDDFLVVGGVHERGDAAARDRVERLMGCLDHGDASSAGSNRG